MWNSLRLAALFVFLFNSFHSTLSLPISKPQQCNGHAELCERKYGNTTFLGAHDAFAVSTDPWALGRNQEFTVHEQLQLGVRMLQVQAHMQEDGLHFCHTSCLIFDGGTVLKFLKRIHTFLLYNPDEVVTLIIANPEQIAPKIFEAVFDESGVAPFAYIPPQTLMKRDDWPTLGDMISSGKRVVVFMDKGFETTSPPDGTLQLPVSAPEVEPTYIIPQFPVMWEDPYDPDDSEFPCRVDRTQGPLKPNEQLNLVNHNLNHNLLNIGHGIRLPNRSSADVTNRATSIIEHASHCAPFVNDNNPNFVLLDWINIGQGMRAVNMLNGFDH